MAIEFESKMLPDVSLRFGTVKKPSSLNINLVDTVGDGMLSGSFPLTLITSGGNLPNQAIIKILYRPSILDTNTVHVVATTTCNTDGSWQVSGLNENLKFDIVARIPGFNDVIISNVQPMGAPLSAYIANLEEEYEYLEEGVVIQVVALGGVPPYTFTAIDLPEGLSIDPNTGNITGNMLGKLDLLFEVEVSDSENTVVNVVGSSFVKGDPHWDNVVSLLHFDKVPLSADAKGKLWTITNSTNVELSTEVQKFGNAVRFGRSGSGYLRADASSEHDLGADDFTIEFWMYKPAPINQNGGLVDFRSIGTRPVSAPTLYLNASSGGRVTYYEKGSILIQTAPIPANTWIHIALCRLGNLITMYENGLAVGTTTKNDSFLTNLPITIGRVGDDLNSNDYYFRGYLDEVRITKGVARYTEDFTPPTKPFPNF